MSKSKSDKRHGHLNEYGEENLADGEGFLKKGENIDDYLIRELADRVRKNGEDPTELQRELAEEVDQLVEAGENRAVAEDYVEKKYDAKLNNNK